MHEIETKIFGIDRKKVEEKLISLGARKVLDNDVRSVSFDFPGNLLRKSKRNLRLRKAGDKAALTLKGPHASDKEDSHPNIKSREEVEVEVSDFGEAMKILESLGLQPWLDYTKHRTSYILDGVRFEFDKYLGKYADHPEFMEIEAKDHATVFKYAKILGFSKKDCSSMSMADIIGKNI